MLPGRHAIRFHLPSFPCGTFGLFSPISHSLRSVVPLGSFFGGCPPPPVTSPATRLNFRRATWLPFSGSFPKGATRFYPGARKKSFDLFLASLSASATGVIATTNRSVFTLSQSVTTLFACPFAGLKDRNLRDGQSYTEKNFSRQSFMCFIFRKTICFSFVEKNAQHFLYQGYGKMFLICSAMRLAGNKAEKRSTKSHETARTQTFLRAISCNFVDRFSAVISNLVYLDSFQQPARQIRNETKNNPDIFYLMRVFNALRIAA